MVRAAVVRHPSAYGISGYNEIQNPPKRHSIVAQQALHRLFDVQRDKKGPMSMKNTYLLQLNT